MMIYQGEVWPILSFRENQTFEGRHPMCWWQVGRLELIANKNGTTFRHWVYRGVWENNPLQTYQLVAPD